MRLKRKAAGLLIIVLTLAALGTWEVWGRQEMLYEEILVLNQDVEPGTVITTGMLNSVKVEKPGRQALRVDNSPQVAGAVSTGFIHGGTELYSEYFEESEYATGEEIDRFAFSVPDEWLLAYPESIRRGDTAVFYSKGKRITEAVVDHVKDSKGQEIYYDSAERLNSSSEVEIIEVILSGEQLKDLGKLADKDAKFVIAYY